MCCFLAAEELLSDSKKAFLSFCLAVPVTRLALKLLFSVVQENLFPYSIFLFFGKLIIWFFFLLSLILLSRAPPLCDAMKLLYQKIPDIASKKSQMYGYLLEQEKYVQNFLSYLSI